MENIINANNSENTGLRGAFGTFIDKIKDTTLLNQAIVLSRIQHSSEFTEEEKQYARENIFLIE